MQILFEGLLEESRSGVVAIALPTIQCTAEAEWTRDFWAGVCSLLNFDLEVKGGRWYLLVSHREKKVAVAYDN